MSSPTVEDVVVLICDDEQDIRLLYRSAFERAGTETALAHDGDQVIVMAEDLHPDVIVLDLMMPNRNGFSALAVLRDRVPASPVIVVSAYASPDNEARALELGADAVYDKLDFLGRIPSIVARFAPASA